MAKVKIVPFCRQLLHHRHFSCLVTARPLCEVLHRFFERKQLSLRLQSGGRLGQQDESTIEASKRQPKDPIEVRKEKIGDASKVWIWYI